MSDDRALLDKFVESKNVFNPDILDCIANLSNDEVFTPPKLVNEVLDTLPPEIWHDSKITFLDPACKSGVWLREVTKRLINGLADEIPDLQERIDHILHKQVFGIAITELTSLLSRRSLYCSKYPNGRYSISRFDDVSGNIWYQNIDHKWKNGRCALCGANQSEYDRSEDKNSYAYGFIHLDPHYWEEVFGVKFDVIIGNPPYQLSDGGGTGDAATPIYNRFIEASIRLNSKYICVIVPSRWMKGGRGLQKFRGKMMDDVRISKMYDYADSRECFPTQHIDGGICYFLWDKLHTGMCEYHYKPYNEDWIVTNRMLREHGMSTIIRDPRQISILKKAIQNSREGDFSSIVSAQKPFGFRTDFFNNPNKYKDVKLVDAHSDSAVKIYGVKGKKGGARRTSVFIDASSVSKNIGLMNRYKLFFSKAYLTTSTVPPEIIVGEPKTICTETFLAIGGFSDITIAENCLCYMKTKFFRAILYFNRHSLNISQESFAGIPLVSFNHQWTDAELYKKYNLSQDEIDYIESTIKEMK